MGEDQKRLFLTIAVCLGIMLAWTAFFSPKPTERPAGEETAAPEAPKVKRVHSSARTKDDQNVAQASTTSPASSPHRR